MKQTFFFALLMICLSQTTIAQIEIKITKFNKDSFDIEFPKDAQLEMNKTYQFILKTNITEEDNLYDNISDTKIKNDKIIQHVFNYHEFSFDIAKYNRKKEATILAHKIIFIKGTKYIVKLDGKTITRHEPNNVTPNSKFEIELTSETEDVNSLKVSEPVILYWMNNQSSFKKIELVNLKASVDLSNESNLKNAKTNQKFNYLILLLPQVSNGKTQLLSESQQERMYIMMYKE
ncbi:hypothetical protein [Limnovirga soli]|uniref:Uncharacterized protein n=1 Tax=Limnovirga soli TaxID=2656915 RepID=A0A8J8FFN7_9BACT|nr:hypothetical protein [Limnovirga soli]NNV56063.1 hypothetical protein [Limnovirga soli]